VPFARLFVHNFLTDQANSQSSGSGNEPEWGGRSAGR